MTGYNPYRMYGNNNQRNSDIVNNTNIKDKRSILRNRTLVNLSSFGRNYNEYAYQNAKLTHIDEDPNTDGFTYASFRNKLNALSNEGTNVASLNYEYPYKLELFKRYAREPEINYYITRLANEIITYTDKKMFCRLHSLSTEKYSESISERAQTIFNEIYDKLGFNIQSRAYDACIDYLVEGYIVIEIVYDDKRKNIVAFQFIDPASVFPVIDEESGIKLWVQHPNSNNPRIILDSDIIYVSYSGSSKYADTSYIEPMIRPYNELKGLERTKIIFNIINSTMHKNINVPMGDIPKHMQESELLNLMSLYKDFIEYDSYEGITYINGSKDLPYSKEAWYIDNGGGGVKVENESYTGTDINEDITLNWFRNNFKQSTRFPLNKLDQASGGGTVYNFGSEVTFDDYNFDQFLETLRSQFQEIIIKPVYTQLVMEFPELIDSNLRNDLDLEFFGNDEILEAKRLNNLQAKIQIGYELTSNFKGVDDDKPFLHPRLVAEHIIKLPKELLDLNELYWKQHDGDIEADGGGSGPDFGGGDVGGDFGGDDFGGDDFDAGIDDFDSGDDFGGDDDFVDDDIGGDVDIE